MRNRLKRACVTVLPLLIYGCQSSLAPTPSPVCLPPPPPAAWIMTPYAPDLSQRMLDELSPSPTAVIGD
ncbi:hypothetical protein PSAKL28_40730 [Pseudomonas alkylphenolica]|uniref:Uncharacterized protein n=1 Tax=Pseudomonas alkylphenolica TaxID=237609 RepID=A0A077FFK1_9PSED|nr:hypothetical protein PSAKL28_40730 [Pseudomonas alkylphenolica]